MENNEYVSVETAILLRKAGYPQNQAGDAFIFTTTEDGTRDYTARPRLSSTLKWLKETHRMGATNDEGIQRACRNIIRRNKG